VLRLLSVGDLTWRHGYEHGLHAVHLLLDRGFACEYRVVGGGPHLPALRFARHQLRLEEHVELVEAGAGAYDLRRADAYVHPAVADVPLDRLDEALAAGLAAVSTAGEPSRRLVLVPRRDPWALADALAALARPAS